MLGGISNCLVLNPSMLIFPVSNTATERAVESRPYWGHTLPCFNGTQMSVWLTVRGFRVGFWAVWLSVRRLGWGQRRNSVDRLWGQALWQFNEDFATQQAKTSLIPGGLGIRQAKKQRLIRHNIRFQGRGLTMYVMMCRAAMVEHKGIEKDTGNCSSEHDSGMYKNSRLKKTKHFKSHQASSPRQASTPRQARTVHCCNNSKAWPIQTRGFGLRI